ncbi:MAG TPA: ABC transporter substrate-binding protein [Chloroflexota bacterium]|nr:ABC transporter substrate-binding protein [Chloroflexota bacterium]
MQGYSPARRAMLRLLGGGALLAGFTAACAPAAPAPTSAPNAQAPVAAPTQAAAPASGATAAAAPTARTAPPSPPVTARITDIQITSAAGSYIAAEKGYFAEEGIQAEFVPVGTADQVPAVVSGSADAAGAAINAFLYNAFARGLPVKIVADHGANLPNASAGGWAVRKDLVDSGAYQGPASVRGWKVALGNAGSTPDVALDRFLQTGGLRYEDVDLTILNFPDQIAAFANKVIDAAYWQEPFTTIAVERGLVVRGPIGYDVYPNQQIAGVLFGDKLLTDREAGIRYLRAYTRGVRDYVKGLIDRDPAMFDQVVPILIEHTTVKDRSLFEKSIPSGLKADPIPNVQSMIDDQEWYLAHGFQNQRINVADLVDLSLIEEAIRQLGSAGR